MEAFHIMHDTLETKKVRDAKGDGKAYEARAAQNLIIDVCTRWNSTYYMLQRAVANKDVSTRPDAFATATPFLTQT